MGEVHDWHSCRCQLCLAAQRLLLLVYNERLGDDFSRICVRKLREVYIKLLDEAESKSKEGKCDQYDPGLPGGEIFEGNCHSLRRKGKERKAIREEREERRGGSSCSSQCQSRGRRKRNSRWHPYQKSERRKEDSFKVPP